MLKQILILLLTCSLTNAADFRHVVAKHRVAAGGCSYSIVDSVETRNNYIAMGTSSSNIFVATRIASTDTFTPCQLEVILQKAGTPPGTITLRIWGGTTTNPDYTQVIASATPFNSADSPAVYDWVAAAATGSESSGTRWLILEMSTAGDGSNFVRVGFDSGTSGLTYVSADGVTWTWVSSASLNYRIRN